MERRVRSAQVAGAHIWDALPQEVLQEILQLLKPRHKAALRLVCSVWRRHISAEVHSVTLCVHDTICMKEWVAAGRAAAAAFPLTQQVVLKWVVPQYDKAHAAKYGKLLPLLGPLFPGLQRLCIRGRILPFAVRNAVLEGAGCLPGLAALQLDSWECSPGSFRKALRHLPNLTSLSLTTGDTICSGFLQALNQSKLTRLSGLELRGMFLDTRLPFQLAAALPGLKKLALGTPEGSVYNNAVGIQSEVVLLAQLPLLQDLEVNVGEASEQGLPPPLGFAALRHLRYSGIYDTHSLAWLARLTQLQTLRLQLQRRGSQPSSSTQSLACVQSLRLRESELQGLSVLSHLPSLQLDITHASRLSLSPLSLLPNLCHLALSWQAMLLGSKGRALRQLAQLTTLTSLEVLPQSLTPLGWNAVPGPTPAFVEALSQLTNLKNLRRLKLRLTVWPSRLLDDTSDVDEATGTPVPPQVPGHTPIYTPLPSRATRQRPQPSVSCPAGWAASSDSAWEDSDSNSATDSASDVARRLAPRRSRSALVLPAAGTAAAAAAAAAGGGQPQLWLWRSHSHSRRQPAAAGPGAATPANRGSGAGGAGSFGLPGMHDASTRPAGGSAGPRGVTGSDAGGRSSRGQPRSAVRRCASQPSIHVPFTGSPQGNMQQAAPSAKTPTAPHGAGSSVFNHGSRCSHAGRASAAPRSDPPGHTRGGSSSSSRPGSNGTEHGRHAPFNPGPPPIQPSSNPGQTADPSVNTLLSPPGQPVNPPVNATPSNPGQTREIMVNAMPGDTPQHAASTAGPSRPGAEDPPIPPRTTHALQGLTAEQGIMLQVGRDDADEDEDGDTGAVPFFMLGMGGQPSCAIGNDLLCLFLQQMPHLGHIDIRPNAFCPMMRQAVLQLPWLQLDC